jgi:hypothetical protein
MAYNPQLTIEGIQEAQARNLLRIAALQPSGAAGEAVRDAAIALHRYAVSITHVGKYNVGGSMVGGGALRAAHRVEVDGLEGQIYIDPGAKNPRSKTKPREYGVYENARGGEHAFYDRTESEYGPTVSERTKTKITLAVLYGE